MKMFVTIISLMLILSTTYVFADTCVKFEENQIKASKSLLESSDLSKMRAYLTDRYLNSKDVFYKDITVGVLILDIYKKENQKMQESLDYSKLMIKEAKKCNEPQ